MPTILINTNLTTNSTSPSSTSDLNEIKNANKECLDNEFRNDLSQLINRLLVKSQTFDSFSIKYDIDDLNNEKKSQSEAQVRSSKKCICFRMAKLFSSLLNDNEDDVKTLDECSPKSASIDNTNSQLLTKELETIKKCQLDLSNKFDLMLSKLNTSLSLNQNLSNKKRKLMEHAASTDMQQQDDDATIGIINNPLSANNNPASNSNNENSSDEVKTKIEAKQDDTSDNIECSNEPTNLNDIDEYNEDDELNEFNDENNFIDDEEGIFDNYYNENDHENENNDIDLIENNSNSNFHHQSQRYHQHQQQQNHHLGMNNNNNNRRMLNNHQSMQHQQQQHHHHQYNQHHGHHNQMKGNNSLNINLNRPNQRAPMSPQMSQQQSMMLQKQSMNLSKSNSSNNNSYNNCSQLDPNDIKIEIDELFKGDGPKFLQLESYKNFKPPIFKNSSNDLYFIEEPLAASAYSKSKSRRNFAAHLTKLVFTPRERLESNCNGRFGKKALDTIRLGSIRNTIFKYYPCKQSTVILNGDTISSGDHDENIVWVRDCIPAIDESNRVLKKQLIAWYKKTNNITSLNMSSSGGNGNNSSGMSNVNNGMYQTGGVGNNGGSGSNSSSANLMSPTITSLITNMPNSSSNNYLPAGSASFSQQNQANYGMDDFEEFDEY